MYFIFSKLIQNHNDCEALQVHFTNTTTDILEIQLKTTIFNAHSSKNFSLQQFICKRKGRGKVQTNFVNLSHKFNLRFEG